MVKNEKGIIMPITLFIVFLLSSYVFFQINQYKIEKELFNEQSELYTAERLLHKAFVDIKQLLNSSSSSSYSGTLHYSNGEVTYIVSQISNEKKSITLISRTLQNRSKRFQYYFHLKNETVSPW